MADKPKTRILSMRNADDIIDCIDVFRKAQIARPSQTEALRALTRLGLERWQEQNRDGKHD